MKTKDSSETLNDESGSVINAECSDLVLTQFVCASLVNEIFKGLLYKKSQIPYPYNWLKNIIIKKRGQRAGSDETKPTNLTIMNHFRVVSNAYDTLECLMKALIKEFSESAEKIIEVLIVFGTTPECPKEVFTINTLSVIQGHNERNHIAQLKKHQQKILRRIFLSQTWMDNMDNSLTSTNTFLFLKKIAQESEDKTKSEQDIFSQVRPLRFPNSVKQMTINFCVDSVIDSNCCDNLLVFSDKTEKDMGLHPENEASYTVVWYQSKHFLQGFKDCYINKTSVSELW